MKPSLFFLFSLLLLVACGDDDSDQPATDQRDIIFSDPASSGGCGNFAIYYYSDDRTYGLELLGDSAQVGLTTDWQEYSVNDARLDLTLYEFSEPLFSFFCDDVLEANETPVREWEATEGTIRLRIAQEANDTGIYTLDVELLDVLVNEIRLPSLERSGVEVGWFPG